MSPDRTALPYTQWPSPITSSDVARAGLRLTSPTVIGEEMWWCEDRPAEGGRTTIVHRAADGGHSDLLTAPWSARSRVHEDGGRPYVVVPDLGVVFSNHADQRLYLLVPGEEPQAITPVPERPAGLRYAELMVRDGLLWCVRETHHEDGKTTRAIVSLPLDGVEEPRERVTGSDFYASPALSPDGRHLAYVCWNHPRLPWTGTDLRVTRLADGNSWTVRGGLSESVLSPQWQDNSHLLLVSDWSGWWNLYQIGIYGTTSRPLYPAEEEFAGPLWQLGRAPYVVLDDGRLAVLHGKGDLRLGLLDPDNGTLTDVDTPYSGWVPGLSTDGRALAGVAYGPAAPPAVVRLDTATGQVESRRQDTGALPDPAYLPTPRAVEIQVRSGRKIHAYVYAPANAGAEGPADTAPPYVVFAHGGPTAHVLSAFDLEKAFFTSRGIGVIDVNYGGSTGYGRIYRDRLRGLWGIVDVEDVTAAAEWLASEGLADPARIAIRGGSAGGWTTMAACCSTDAFAGGVSYYGVSALAPFNAHTHDFESRYVEWLVGPEDSALYAEREPISRADGVTCPMLLLQGLDDPVVPPEQSAGFAAALAERGVPCTYLTFEGESHGFRRAETRVAALAAELAFYQQVLSD
ncbi:Dipeptidyl aminopeptidase/acylaminoacyl peptidase [Sinosporangium album]|uniref:Dipeptidyl aminopeptidase/acylaminoacyl peptidase n=1 Tax=Sinosporangium album TaxID=504805 RepID=A0A1G7S0M9_9ACTN|nr:prolyl oligopeptidase family serine peptidase [Sinosporangium album]SDG16575.1 Dipeptidyl aminopeptidase/acylaminoacyl peptidase [Sinosporangium album]